MSDQRVAGAVSFVTGQNPEAYGAGNYLTAAGPVMRMVSGFLNSILSKRLKVHFSGFHDESNTQDPDENAVRVLVRTSPNVYGLGINRYLRVRLVLTAGRDDAATEPDPQVYVQVRCVSSLDGFTTAAAIVHNTHRDDTNIGPDNLHYLELELAAFTNGIERGRTYDVRIATIDKCQIIAATVFEVPRLALNTAGGDVVAPTDPFYVGGRIYDEDLADLWEALRRCFDDQGSVFFAWSPIDSSRAASVTAASFTNLWSAATAWADNEYGFWVWPELQGPLNQENDVGVVFWAILDPGWDGSDQLIGALELVSEFATIAHLDVQNYAPVTMGGDTIVTIALQTTWSGGGAFETALLNVLGKYDGATEMKVLACGLYAKEPLDVRGIEDLALWLRADDLDLADTDPVETWPDHSGNGNDAAQATGGLKPVFVEGAIGGKNAVRFDGTDDYLAIADSATYKGAILTVFVVAAVTATNADMLVVGYPHAGTHTSPYYRWALLLHNTADIDLVVAADVKNYTKDFSTRTPWRVWSYVTSTRSSWRDGDLVGADAASPPSITYPTAVGLRIGADAAGGSPFGGDIAELIVFTRALTTRERQDVEEMLAERYGLQRGGGF